MNIKTLSVFAIMASMTEPALGNEAAMLYAAGSLRGALNEVAAEFQKATKIEVKSKYGPSGLLKDEIESGAKAEVFASANMNHPQALAKANKAGPVQMFARNRLCALVRPGLEVTPANLLDRLLDEKIKVGTSTPRADPSGDYAWEVFKKADAIQPGSFAALDKKALQLTGGPNSPTPPKDKNVYGLVVAEGQADIFLTYCTNAIVAKRENPTQNVVALPEQLAVGADYGLTLVNGSSASAKRLADYILSADGQAILAKHGFSPPAK
jgi:ABC-type molybdate transport system substrate-binding protein